LNSTANLKFTFNAGIGENEKCDLYLDLMIATGEKVVPVILFVSFNYFGLPGKKDCLTEMGFAALKVGKGIQNCEKLLSYLETSASEASEIWGTQAECI